MINPALIIERLASGSVGTYDNVMFDNTAYIAGNISYVNGEIIFEEDGLYLVQWYVSTQSSASTIGTVFAISTSRGDRLRGNSPIKTTEVVGMCLVDVIGAPVTASLMNVSSDTVFYSPVTPVKAWLVAIKSANG